MDKISIDYNVEREELNKYIDEINTNNIISSTNNSTISTSKAGDENNILCSGVTKKGTPCTNKVKGGNKFCGRHLLSKSD